MEDALERMMAATSEGDQDVTSEFIPSQEWKGSKPGYFFGTTHEHGVGYHRDHATMPIQPVTTPTMTRKRARMDEVTVTTKPEPQDLLRLAEESVDPKSTVMDLTPKGVQQACKSLQKSIAKNALQRAQYPDSPKEYMESELALQEQIQSFRSIASTPSLFPTLVEQCVLSDFVTLLSHENTDIALTVIQVLMEWLDPTEDGVHELATHVASECLDLVVANLGRLDLTNDEDSQGMEYILTLVEHLIELDINEDLPKTCLVSWLFQHLSEIRAAEVLALVFQQASIHTVYPDLSQLPSFTSPLVEDNGKKLEALDGLELLLQAMAKYRKTQPDSDEQVEHLENISTILASALAFSSINEPMFLERQGMELVLRCIREKVHSGGVGLQLLDIREKASCEHLVLAGGLKSLFPLFMGRSIPKPASCSDAGKEVKKARKEWLLRIEQNLIHIIYNWTRFLEKDSPEHAFERLLGKFLEKDCEKCDHLVELLLEYDKKTRMTEYKFYRSDIEESLNQDDIEAAAMEAKLSGGGEFFHRLGAIAAFCCVHSKKCHSHILDQLTLQKSGIGVVKAAVEDFVSILEDGDQKCLLKSYLDKI